MTQVQQQAPVSRGDLLVRTADYFAKRGTQRFKTFDVKGMSTETLTSLSTSGTVFEHFEGEALESGIRTTDRTLGGVMAAFKLSEADVRQITGFGAKDGHICGDKVAYSIREIIRGSKNEDYDGA